MSSPLGFFIQFRTDEKERAEAYAKYHKKIKRKYSKYKDPQPEFLGDFDKRVYKLGLIKLKEQAEAKK